MICIFLLFPIALVASVYVDPGYLDELQASGKYEEFAELLGIDVRLARPIEDNVTYSSLMSTASPWGDILVPRGREEEARQGVNFEKDPDKKWPNNELPYYISFVFLPSHRAIIQDAIDDFNSRVSNLKLVPKRLFLNDYKSYVYIFSGNGCYTYLGKSTDVQPLSLQSVGCVLKGTVQHEFMHAAGFIHEHTRPDRDNYIRVIKENISPQWHPQYEKVSEDKVVLLDDYDYYSVMHYRTGDPEGTGRKAIEILQEGIDEERVGNPEIPMNDRDVKRVDKLYA